MTAQAQIKTVPFHGQSLSVIPQQDKLFVAIKPICENMGIQWHAQRKRIQRDDVLGSTASMMDSVAADGKNRDLLCLPLEFLNGWLFGIDTNRIKNPEVKARVIEYKKECYQALFDYWTKGEAVSPRKKRQPQQVIGSEGMRCLSALIKGKTSHLKGRDQQSASTRLWNQLHTAFDVCSGMDIPEDQFNDARTFIASYAVEGEYLAKEEQRGDEGYYYQEYGRYFADGRAILDELDKYVPGDAKTLLKQLDNVLLCSWTHMDESLSRLKVITAGLEKWRGPRSNLQHPFAQVR